MRKSNCLFSAAVLLLLASNSAGQLKVDARLPDYIKVQEATGEIKAVGDDTLNNTMALLAEEFLRVHPKITFEIEGKGYPRPPVALLTGPFNFAPLSNAMNQKSIDAFKTKWGYEPVGLALGYDLVGFVVHKDNPIAQRGLTLAQVDAIYSTTRKRGHREAITTWGQLGLDGPWRDRPIVLQGRNPASGTYGFVRSTVLLGGDFMPSVNQQPGSNPSVQAVEKDPNSIAYAGISYVTANTRMVPLSIDDKSKPVPASVEHLKDYPLTRRFWMYMNHKPGTQLDPLRSEFVKLLYSSQGQEMIIKDGYVPLSAKTAKEEAAKVGVTIELKPAKGQ